MKRPTGSGRCACLALLTLACAARAQADDWLFGEWQIDDWQSPSLWPALLTLQGDAPGGELVVVEQNGADLGQRLDDAPWHNATRRTRLGPELLYLPPGSHRLTLEPRYDNVPAALIRLHRLSLPDDPAVIAAARALGQPDTESASDPDHCARYARALQVLPARLEAVLTYLQRDCLQWSEQYADSDLPVGIPDEGSFGLFPYHVLWQSAQSAMGRDRLAEARDLFVAALASAGATQARHAELHDAIELDMASLQVQLAGTQMYLAWAAGDIDAERGLEQAVAGLDRAIAIAQRRGEPLILGEAEDFLAAVEFVRGNDAGVINHLLRARDAVALGGRPEELVAILGSIGDYHKRWGNLRSAFDAYRQAQDLVRDHGLDNMGADTSHNLGTWYLELGDFTRAAEYLTDAKQGWRQIGNERRAINIATELALVLEATGDLEGAQDMLAEVDHYYVGRAELSDPRRLEALVSMSRLALARNDVARARELFDAAAQGLAQRTLNANVETAELVVAHAQLLYAEHDVDGALQRLDQRLATSADPADRITLLAGKLTLLHGERLTGQAIATADAVFALIESRHMQIESVRLGPRWTGRVQAIYASHVDYLLENGLSAELAFAVVERARSFSLRLRRQEVLLARQEQDPALRDAWLDLQKRAIAAAGPGDDQDASLQRERELAQAHEALFSRIEGHPLALPSVLSLDEVRAALPEGAVLVDYIEGERSVWRIDLTRDSQQLVRLGERDAIVALRDAALSELLEGGEATMPALAQLSDTLLRNVDPDVGGARVLISPGTLLGAVPFSAIFYSAGHADPALVEVPSVSEYFTGERLVRADQTLALAVLADPDFGSMVAPQGDIQGLVRGWSDTLARLPATAEEASSLSAFYAEHERLILTGGDASERNFFSEPVRNARIIHLATHAYFDADQPELVGFAMARQDDGDGFVSMAEIAGSDFNADLVVISACSSALGETIPGEGHMSLARTFLAQGVNSVLSTLWPVSDRASALFMHAFYAAINEQGMDYAQALQFARDNLRQNPAYRHPYYWAAYSLVSAVHQGASE